MATIIKAGSQLPTAAVGEPVAFNLDDVAQRAKEFVEQAKLEALEILQQARHESQAIRKQAEQEGYKAGMARADQTLDERIGQRLQMVLPAVEQAAQQIETARQAWLAHWQQAALGVATAIAACVIRREVRHAPEVTVDLLAEALRLAAGSDELAIRMHPEDLAALGPQIERLTEELRRLAPTSLVPDASIERGGCRVETRFGMIDQQFASQLQRIEQELQ